MPNTSVHIAYRHPVTVVMAENATEKEVNMTIVLLSNTNNNNNNCEVALWVMFPADGLILTFWKPPYS